MNRALFFTGSFLYFNILNSSNIKFVNILTISPFIPNEFHYRTFSDGKNYLRIGGRTAKRKILNPLVQIFMYNKKANEFNPWDNDLLSISIWDGSPSIEKSYLSAHLQWLVPVKSFPCCEVVDNRSSEKVGKFNLEGALVH